MRLNKSLLARALLLLLFMGIPWLLQASPALAAPPAHDQPDGANWLMADWMLLSFLVFAGAALAMLLFTIKRGLLRNLEGAKFYILSIDEPDYYTPEWAREVDNAPRP